MPHPLATVPTLFLLALSLSAAELPDWLQAMQPADESWKQTAQELVFNNTTEPQTLDPALMTGVPESRIALGLFEGLVSLQPETLEPIPGAAERWERSEDGLTYTFFLREEGKWSNGDPVTATDFLLSWKRVLTTETASEYAYQLYPVKGAEAYHKGELEDFDQVGIEVLGKLTLKVTLTNPCPYFLDLAAFQTLFPTHAATVARHGGQWTQPANFVGNGPFTLADWQPRNRIVLRKNPHWHGASYVKLQSITIHPYEDLETGVKLFKQGKIHWQPAVPSGRVPELKHDPDYYCEPYLGVYFYRFNVNEPPFDDPLVRQAMSLAIDRTVITEHILGAGQQPTTTFCPPGTAGYQPIQGLGYDKAKARDLWAQTDYGKGIKDLPELELLYNTSEDHKKVAENVVQQWKENLGITVSLRNMEWKVYLDHMTKKDYQLMRSAWIGDYNDPNTFFGMFVTDGGNNRTGWSNDRYDALLTEAATTADHGKRLDLFQEMERILVVEDCPIMPLYFYVNQGLVTERLGGFHFNVRDYHPYQYLWLDPEVR